MLSCVKPNSHVKSLSILSLFNMSSSVSPPLLPRWTSLAPTSPCWRSATLSWPLVGWPTTATLPRWRCTSTSPRLGNAKTQISTLTLQGPALPPFFFHCQLQLQLLLSQVINSISPPSARLTVTSIHPSIHWWIPCMLGLSQLFTYFSLVFLARKVL